MEMRLNKYKRRISRGLIGFLVVSLLVGLFVLPVNATEDEQVIKVGVFPYKELMMKSEDGRYSGYGYEYLQEISRYTGWTYKYVDGTWEECLEMLKTGEIDLMGGLVKTEEREKSFDFVDEPFIDAYGVLVTNKSNKELPFNDFEAFEGLRVGAIEQNIQAETFLKFSKDAGFTPKIVYYKTEDDLDKALGKGEIGAKLATSMLIAPELRVIAKYGESEGCFATTKGNTALLKQMNAVMEEIKLHDPYFNSVLSKKYFDIQTQTQISFTREELEYIKSAKTLRCNYNPELRPISYSDGDQNVPKGMAMDIAKIIEEKTGLVFEIIPTETLNGAIDEFYDGDANLFLTKNKDVTWRNSNKGFISMPYLTGQLVTIGTHRENHECKVAWYDGMPESAMTAEFLHENASVVKFSTLEEALNAVNDGDADITFANSVVMSYYMNDPKYGGLASSPAYGHSVEVCIAVNPEEDPILLSILNKALASISESEINHIIAQNTSNPEARTIKSLIYTDPIAVVAVILIVFIAITSAIFILFRTKSKSEQSMKKMLYTDPITGYPNYKAMVEDAPKLIGDSPEDFVLIYMDMHQFKSINDIFGYEVGDNILRSISERLKEFIRDDERFGRVYADNFAILLRYTTREELEERLRKLSGQLSAISEEHFDNSSFIFTGGIYRLEKDYGNLDYACDKANYAKDSIKGFFSNTFVAYNDVLHQQILNQKNLEDKMASALENHEFIPYYQPKVNALTGEVIGAEALTRWKTTEGKIIPPMEFLPFYEKNGFIVQIDFAMFEAVCKDMHDWLEEGKQIVITSVNFSRRHMTNKTFALQLMTIAERYHIPPNMLEVEITETMGMESMEVAIEFVRSIQEYGFGVSIDDFGEGYSSIALLQEMPLDVLKLDKKFIENAMKIPKAGDVMKYLVKAMKKNNIKIVCEGIETEEQRDFVLKQNCLYIQGYLYSKPLPLEEFQEYLNNSKVALPQQFDIVSITDFDPKIWGDSDDFLNRAMPGWMVAFYPEAGYPLFYVSDDLLDALGYGEQEYRTVTGGLFSGVMHPDDWKEVENQLTSLDMEEGEVHLQYRMLKKDGSVLWIRNTTKRIIIDNGKEALLGDCIDITDIMMLQLEKEVAHTKYEMALQLTNHAIYEYDIREKKVIAYSGPENFDVLKGNTENFPESILEAGIVHPNDEEIIVALFERIHAGETSCKAEVRIRLNEGQYVWIRIITTTVFAESGEPFKTIGVLENVDQRKRFEEAYLKEEQYRIAMKKTSIMAYDINVTKNYVDDIDGTYSERVKRIAALLSDSHNYTQMLETSVKAIIAKCDQDQFLMEMSLENLNTLYSNGTMEKEFEYRYLLVDGAEAWVSVYLHFTPDTETGDIICLVHCRDIQKRKEREIQLIAQAESDPLTGLLNRSSAERIIKGKLSSLNTYNRKHAFLMIDIDLFKSINDQFGHNVGDQCLIKIADMLKAKLRTNDVIARMGGDEIAIFLQDISHYHHAKTIADKIKLGVKDLSREIDEEVNLSVSIGIAMVPDNGETFEELYQYADKEMYQSKEKESRR